MNVFNKYIQRVKFMTDISKVNVDRIEGLEEKLSVIVNQITELENKLSNKNYVIQYPTITETGRIAIPANTDYTLTENCWVWWGNTTYAGNRTFYINGIVIGRSYGNYGIWEEFNSMFIPLKAGNVIRHTGDNSLCYIYPN